MSVLEAALGYARAGWAVFPLAPRSKAPAVSKKEGGKGYLDATTDERMIVQWFERRPDLNLGIATGAPGPTVLDIDDLVAASDLIARCIDLGAPTVATARGLQFYFAGTSNRTIGLGYGELRSVGSYTVAPPSIHPSLKTYVWIAAPHGTLPTVPDSVGRGRRTAGCGMAPLREQVPPGQMYEFLLDRAIRLARAGEADPDVIEAALIAMFAAKRIPGASYGDPVAGRRDTRRLAEWAAGSEIAIREAKRTALVGRPLPVRAPRPIGGGS